MQSVSIGADHAGIELKDHIKSYLEKKGLKVVDHGCHDGNRVDYPDFAAKVANDIQNGATERGILVCGTGIGMALTANKFPGVRAASVVDEYSMTMTRAHNDLNILCLGSRVIGVGKAESLVDLFLSTEFEGGRHENRVKKIREWETKNGLR